MKNLTKFQKQIVAVSAVALLAVILFVMYLVFKPEEKAATKPVEKPVELNYGFNEAEETALKDFKGSATISFKQEQGKGDEKTAPLMNLAADYAAMSKNISLVFGEGDADCIIKCGDKTLEIDTDEVKYHYNDEGDLYAFSGVRYQFNMTLFNKDCGVKEGDKQPLAGFDAMGNVLNQGGNIVMFSLGSKYGELLSVSVSNKQSEDITFYVNPDTSLPAIIGAEGMEVQQASSVMLMSFAQNPVATGVVENPEELSVYGLDSDENAQATILVVKDEDTFRSIRVGKPLPGGGGYYALCDNEKNVYKDTVYIVSGAVSYAMYSKEQFLTASYGEKLEKLENVFDSVNDMEIGFGDEVMKIEYLTEKEKKDLALNYTWKVTAPDRFIHSEDGFALSNYYNLGDLFNALSSLSSNNIVVASPTEEDLAKYGLDKPFRSYSWLYMDVIRCKVYMTEPDANGNIYVYGQKTLYPEKGDPVSYTLGIGVVSTQAFANPDGVSYTTHTAIDFVNNKLYTEYIKDVDSITVIRGEDTHVFKLNKNDKGDVGSATLDNKETDLQSVRRFYVSCIHPEIIDEYFDEVPDTEDLCLIMDKDGVETEIKFTRLNSVEVFATVNGKGNYIVSYDDYSAIIEDLEILLSGGIIPR